MKPQTIDEIVRQAMSELARRSHKKSPRTKEFYKKISKLAAKARKKKKLLA